MLGLHCGVRHWHTEIMMWAWVLGAWAVISVPIALLLGRLFANGHRNDPRPVGERRAAASAHSTEPPTSA